MVKGEGKRRRRTREGRGDDGDDGRTKGERSCGVLRRDARAVVEVSTMLDPRRRTLDSGLPSKSALKAFRCVFDT